VAVPFPLQRIIPPSQEETFTLWFQATTANNVMTVKGRVRIQCAGGASSSELFTIEIHDDSAEMHYGKTEDPPPV